MPSEHSTCHFTCHRELHTQTAIPVSFRAFQTVKQTTFGHEFLRFAEQDIVSPIIIVVILIWSVILKQTNKQTELKQKATHGPSLINAQQKHSNCYATKTTPVLKRFLAPNHHTSPSIKSKKCLPHSRCPCDQGVKCAWSPVCLMPQGKGQRWRW